jgi:hypothetical protein
MDEHISGLPQSVGSRQCNVLINADIFVTVGVNASIQVTVMLNAPQHQMYLHPDVGAVKKQLNDKIEFLVLNCSLYFLVVIKYISDLSSI